MADLKISELPAITTTTDADVLPIVQVGVTDKITVANVKINILPAVGSSGNVMTSNGSAWSSQAPPAGGDVLMVQIFT